MNTYRGRKNLWLNMPGKGQKYVQSQIVFFRHKNSNPTQTWIDFILKRFELNIF